MIRTFGFQTLAGTSPVPIFGDVTTAAFSNLKPPNGLYTVKVTASGIYIIGDRIILGYGQAGQNCLLVESIPDSTTLLCASEGDAKVSNWNTSTQIALSIACTQLLIEGKSGNAASLWVGADSTLTNSGGGSAFHEIGKVAAGAVQTPFTLQDYGLQNPLRTTEVWIAGATSDKFAAAAWVN